MFMVLVTSNKPFSREKHPRWMHFAKFWMRSGGRSRQKNAVKYSNHGNGDYVLFQKTMGNTCKTLKIFTEESYVRNTKFSNSAHKLGHPSVAIKHPVFSVGMRRRRLFYVQQPYLSMHAGYALTLHNQFMQLFYELMILQIQIMDGFLMNMVCGRRWITA